MPQGNNVETLFRSGLDVFWAEGNEFTRVPEFSLSCMEDTFVYCLFYVFLHKIYFPILWYCRCFDPDVWFRCTLMYATGGVLVLYQHTWQISLTVWAGNWTRVQSHVVASWRFHNLDQISIMGLPPTRCYLSPLLTERMMILSPWWFICISNTEALARRVWVLPSLVPCQWSHVTNKLLAKEECCCVWCRLQSLGFGHEVGRKSMYLGEGKRKKLKKTN